MAPMTRPTLLKLHRTILLAAGGLYLALLGGCAYPDFQKPLFRNYLRDAMVKTERPPEPERISADRLDEMAEAIRWDDAPLPEAYGVGPGDVLSVKVTVPGAQTPTSEFTAAVDTRGTIRCPLLGPVFVEGMTVGQVSETLKGKYSGTYFREPAVEVAVAEYRSKRAMVTGQVKNPGEYPILGDRVSLLRLLIEAEGLSDGAGDAVLVTRANSPNAEANSAPERFSLDRLMRQGDLRRNGWIYPGDAVHVPPRAPEYFYVVGFVPSPGPYELPRDGEIGMVDAVSHARGLSSAARAQYTYLVRYEGGERKVYNVDMARIAAALEPDIPVQADDRIIVSTDWMRRAFDGFMRIVGLRAWLPAL